MSRTARPLRPAAIVMGGVLGLLAGPCLAEATLDRTGQGAGARLNFVVKIPAVLRIIDNSHPSQLQANADGVALAQQRLELQSNLKQGFCVLLRQPQVEGLQWSLEALSGGPATARPVQGGYQVCFRQPGRHVVNLQHSFTAPTTAMPAVWSWPLMTEVLAI